MDTVTHALFGLTLYGAFDKRALTAHEKQALLFTTVVGSEIPDIDVISRFWDEAGRYQMWHRGLTHSVLLVPLWALLLLAVVWLLWRIGNWKLFGAGALAVWIHDSSDLFNAWGTGYFEPFSQMRVTFGTVPIVDVVFWLLMLAGLLAARYGRERWQPHKVYQTVWLLMALHVAVQSIHGYALYREAKQHYEQVALSADFIPGVFTVVGKNGAQVILTTGATWSGQKHVATLTSREDADLNRLFDANPKARTLKEWAPFVVVVDDGQRVGVYDPRFYRNGQSFLFEFMDNDKSR